MGGVDYNDQMTRLKKQKRQKKGYTRLVLIFMWCYNSYLVYKHLNPDEKVYYPAYIHVPSQVFQVGPTIDY